MCEIIPFDRQRPSSKAIALKISGMSNGDGASLGLFKPLEIDINLCGSNGEFGRTNLPQVRLAILTCQRDGAGVREAVKNLAEEPGAVVHLMRNWDSTAAYFGELISIMALAHERFEITAKALGIEVDEGDGGPGPRAS